MPDSRFQRVKDDLYATQNIDLYTALLGGEVLVNTLSGQVKLQVKPGTQNGTKVRLKGKGYPVYKKENSYGDLFITYQVELPAQLNETQKDLLRQMKEAQ